MRQGRDIRGVDLGWLGHGTLSDRAVPDHDVPVTDPRKLKGADPGRQEPFPADGPIAAPALPIACVPLGTPVEGLRSS